MAEHPTNLRSLFEAAKGAEKDLGILDSSENRYHDTLSRAIHSLEECQRLIQDMSLFSLNETADELATSAIQYLGVDYLLAHLLLKSYDDDRRGLLQRAANSFTAFLGKLNAYELLSKQNQQLLDKYLEDSSSFCLAPSNDAAGRRHVKVGRYQEEKKLKAQLEVLCSQATSNLVDEATVRQCYLTELEIFAAQTFEALDMITREVEILSQMNDRPAKSPDRSDDERHKKRTEKDQYSERLDDPLPQIGRGGPLLSKGGKPLQPFTITDKRTHLRREVFRPGHNLPTMDIDEYLEEERRRGGIVDSEGENQKPAPTSDEDNMVMADQETMKARAWDEYVEANPKGSGNTMNRG